jgi:hypothetical protein
VRPDFVISVPVSCRPPTTQALAVNRTRWSRRYVPSVTTDYGTKVADSVATTSRTWFATGASIAPKSRIFDMDTLLHMAPAIAAIGYSLVYLLAGGGFFGAFVIFVVAKMLGR